MQSIAADPAQSFLIVKATEGMGGRNSDYAAQRAAAGAKFLGAYHFAWTAQDPLKEADNFLANSMLKPGEVPFLDAEKYDDSGTVDWAKAVTYCLAWLDSVKAKSGATPVVYANWNWIKGLRTAATQEQWDRLTAYPLWLADYSEVGGKHSTVTAKDGSNQDDWPIVLHQFTSTPVDHNWTPDLAALKACAVTKEA